MSRMRWICAASVCFVVYASFVQASREGQPLRFGLSGSVETMDNRDAAATNTVDNMDIFLRPFVELAINTGSTVFNLHYEPGLRYRSDPGENQNEYDLQHRLTLGVKHKMGPRSRVRASNTFLKIEDPRIAEGGAVLRADRSYILNTLQAGLNYDVGRLSNLDMSLKSQLRLYDDSNMAILSDKNEIGVGLAFRRALTVKLRALLNAAYNSYSFRDTDVRSRDFDSITGSLGAEYVITPQVIGSISGGLQTHSYDADERETDDNIFVSGEVNGTLTRDLVAGMITTLGVRDADVFPYASQDYAEFRGYADLALSGDLSLRGAVTYRVSSYDAIPALDLAGGDETVTVFDLQLTYRINALASLLAGHRYEDVSADEGLSGSFTRNTSRVGMRLDF